MNYLELMVSVEPVLLVFIPTHFQNEMNGPAGPGEMGPREVWVIFQAWSGMGVLISWVRLGFLGVFFL